MNKVDLILFYKKWKKNSNHPIFNKILNNSGHSYYFVSFLLEKNEKIPNNFIKTILRSSFYTKEIILKFVVNNLDIPKIIIDNIYYNSKIVSFTIFLLIEKNKKIPKKLINYIKNSKYKNIY